MLTLPQEMKNVILPFVALFSETVWDYGVYEQVVRQL